MPIIFPRSVSVGDLERALLPEGFFLIERTGAGGFGEVYKVHDRGQNVRAVKLITVPKKLHPAVALAYGIQHHEGIMEREKYTDVFRHPNIVQLHSSGILFLKEREIGYVITEHVEGPTLEEAIASEIHSGEEVRIMKELTSAIAHLHEFGIIHNDIKPDNVKLDEERKRRTVVLDFSNAEETNTATGVAKNKHAALPTTKYRAPELDKGNLPSLRSDVWALGAVFYELLTKKNIKKEAEREQCSLQNLVKRNIPRKWRKVIAACVQEAPEQRYADARQLAHGLFYANNYYSIRVGIAVGIPTAAAAIFFLPFAYMYAQRSLTAYDTHQCITAIDERNVPKEAEQYCRNALWWDSSEGTAWLYLGHSLIEQGKDNDAEYAYRKADLYSHEERDETSGNIKVELQEREMLLSAQGRESQAAALHDISEKLHPWIWRQDDLDRTDNQ